MPTPQPAYGSFPEDLTQNLDMQKNAPAYHPTSVPDWEELRTMLSELEDKFMASDTCLIHEEKCVCAITEFLQERIPSLLKEERTTAYKEGVKDGEGTKNGVERYQLGYKDGRDALLKEVMKEIENMKVKGLGNLSPKAPSEVIPWHMGHYLNDSLTALQHKLTSE